jgi:hypothetical protein
MKILKNALKILATIFLVVAIFLFFYLPTLATSEKARGNRLAQLDCRMYLIAASSTKTNSSFFEFSKLSKEERHRALCLAIYLDLLVKTNFVWSGTSNRLIVAVCPREFHNVPEPILFNLYHKNPAHAVGFSDGTVGLISPTEFTNLNLSGFVSAASLATNSEFNIFKN